MKTSFTLLALASIAATSCVEQQSHWRRSQRLGSEVGFWQMPAAYVEALGDPSAPGTPLIPTSGLSGAGFFETGLAPIFDVFRPEVPSETAPVSAPPMFNVADALANASLDTSMSRQLRPERQVPIEEPIVPASFDHLPYAVAIPGKPGFVTIPGYASLGEVDVVGISRGTPVEVPAGAGTVQFRVP